MSAKNLPSPGNGFIAGVPPMRMPHLEHMYRLVAQMAPTGYEIPKVCGSGYSRSSIHIASGEVVGPKIKAKLVENSGADWAIQIHSKKVVYRLEARYAMLTDDGHYILINAKGIFKGGPGIPDPDQEPPTCTQDEVEYFSHLTFEAPGESPYNWMNTIVAVGVMTMWEHQVVIDAYRLTNFPGVDAESVFVGR